MLIFSALSTSQLRSDELKCQCNSQILIAQLLIPCFMETKGRNCRGYRNVFNPSNKKPSSPGVPTRLKFARIILNQQPTASRLLHHMIAKLLESNGWFQHEAFIWPKSDCSYLICFRKKTHFSPHITTHITRISSCSNCSEFCKNDLQHKRCSVQLCVCVFSLNTCPVFCKQKKYGSKISHFAGNCHIPTNGNWIFISPSFFRWDMLVSRRVLVSSFIKYTM